MILTGIIIMGKVSPMGIIGVGAQMVSRYEGRVFLYLRGRGVEE
jgi:hypothetical protein